MAEITKPTIHCNGSAAGALLAGYRDAARDVRKAPAAQRRKPAMPLQDEPEKPAGDRSEDRDPMGREI